MISIKQVHKTFGKLHALNDVNLELTSGKSYALIGPNGSGKTTLMKSILGLVVPSSGQIYFDGKLIARDWQYREKIGYMPQIGRYPENMTIGQLIDMIKNIRQQDTLDEELIGDRHGADLRHARHGGDAAGDRVAERGPQRCYGAWLCCGRGLGAPSRR